MEIIDFPRILVHGCAQKGSRQILAQRLCALMRESQHLGALLVAKTLIVCGSPIGKTHRRDLEVFHESTKELRLSQQRISRVPWKDELEVTDIQ